MPPPGCVACAATASCSAACPSNCIYIEAAENTAENRISGAERYAAVYNIDFNRCIFCGYCVEACPTDAITHGHGFELATFNASNLVYRKEQLLVPVSAPWLKASEAIDFARAVKAPRNLAIHDRIYSEAGLGVIDAHMDAFLPQEGLEYVRRADGEDL